MKHVLWVAALMEACDVTKRGRHLGHHLGFYQELKKRSKRRELKLKYFSSFYACYVLLKSLRQVQKNTRSPSKFDGLLTTRVFTQKWLDHPLFMTSYLVTIVTDHHSKCLRGINKQLLKASGANV